MYKRFSHYILILFCILIFPPILWTINLMFMSIDCKATAKIIKHVSDCFRKTRHICQPEPVVKHLSFCEYLIFSLVFNFLTNSGNSLHLFILQFTSWKNIIFYLHFSDVEVLVLTVELIFIVIDVFISVFWW